MSIPPNAVRAALAVVLLCAAPLRAQENTSVPSGDPKKGKVLFEQTYRCYACHGYLGEAGTPRLVPMARSQDQFVAYLRKPNTPGMPTFAEVPAQALHDVYAYIRSLKPESPTVDGVPLLKDLLQQIQKTK
jgi:mono/diheme cytochrome c family protein